MKTLLLSLLKTPVVFLGWKTMAGVVLFGTLSTVLYSAESDEARLHPRVIATGLEVPWQIDFTPDRRIFVTERGGRVVVLEPERGSTKNTSFKQTVWATLENVFDQGEAGLLGLAIDPRFEDNSYVYLAYNKNRRGKSYHQLVRYVEVTNKKGGQLRRTGRFDKVLIDGPRGAVHHNGGRLKFAADETLFWGVGDRLVPRSAQNLGVLTGKILRMTRDGGIPTNNPFPDSYVYSYGHRNVQGIAFSGDGKRIFASEHGPSSWNHCCRDEVNEIHPGSNYGWPVVSGDETHPEMQAPLIHSGTKTTWAPGGLVYVDHGNWAHSLLVTGLRGRSLYRIVLRGRQSAQNKAGTETGTKAQTKEKGSFSGVEALEVYFKGKWGRLRDIARAPKRYGFSGDYYILTSNRDRRGNPAADDDRIIQLTLP